MWTILGVDMRKNNTNTHCSVMYPLTVAILQGSSQLPGQLTFVNIAMQIRDRI